MSEKGRTCGHEKFSSVASCLKLVVAEVHDRAPVVAALEVIPGNVTAMTNNT